MNICKMTKYKMKNINQRKNNVFSHSLLSYLLLKLAKISKNTTSRADNSKKRMVTPNFFLLKMYLVSCFCVMQSLKKFSPLVLTPGYVLKSSTDAVLVVV